MSGNTVLDSSGTKTDNAHSTWEIKKPRKKIKPSVKQPRKPFRLEKAGARVSRSSRMVSCQRDPRRQPKGLSSWGGRTSGALGKKEEEKI